eukprot:9909141-Lingulodinium_polyedra.AAC.1
MARAARRVDRVLPRTAALRTLLRALEMRALWRGRSLCLAGPRSMPRSAMTPGASIVTPSSARSPTMSRASAGGLVKMPDLPTTVSPMARSPSAKPETAPTMPDRTICWAPSVMKLT